MNSKTAERSSARVPQPPFGALWSKSSLVRVAKNVSATALSKQEPTAPIDCAIPASWQAWPNSRPMNWADSTGRGNTSMGGGCDGQAGGVDEGVDGPVADEVAGRAVAAARCRASVLAADRGG